MLTGTIMLGNLRRMQKAIHVDGSIKDYRGIVIANNEKPVMYSQNSCMALEEKDFTGEWRAYAMQSFPLRDKPMLLNILNFDESVASFFRWRLMMNFLEKAGKMKKRGMLTPAGEFGTIPNVSEIMSDADDIDFFFEELKGHEKNKDIYHGMELRCDGLCDLAMVNSFCRQGTSGEIYIEHLGFVSLANLGELHCDFNAFLANDNF